MHNIAKSVLVRIFALYIFCCCQIFCCRITRCSCLTITTISIHSHSSIGKGMCCPVCRHTDKRSISIPLLTTCQFIYCSSIPRIMRVVPSKYILALYSFSPPLKFGSTVVSMPFRSIIILNPFKTFAHKNRKDSIPIAFQGFIFVSTV